MWWANWISLGIIVTLLVCMVQRLVSSMRPTKNAFAASCRHIMVLPWKHRSVLPTALAISQTSCEKGSFLIRSSVLFWNCQISWRATVPGWYFLVFFTFPALRNSFWGALPPKVGWSFLLAGSSPKTDGLASAAIWTNCQVGNDNGNLPTSSSLFHHLLHPPLQVRAFCLGRGGAPERGASFPSLLSFLSPLLSLALSLPPSPSLASA